MDTLLHHGRKNVINLVFSTLKPLKKATLAFLLLFATASFVNAQTLTTDFPDYPPGTTVTLTGTGFTPGEDITMRVIHVGDPLDNDTSADHQPWTIQADVDGNFTTTWYVPADQDELGATLLATADGVTSLLHAEVVFTDALGITITSSPSAVSGTLTICSTTSVTFTATLSCTPGVGNRTYVWKIGAATLATHIVATGTTDTWTPASLANGDVVTCQVTFVNNPPCNGNPQTSNAITMTVATGVPSISVQPTDKSACAGTGTSFSVTASGVGLSYQWQDNSSGSFANIAGATSPTLSLASVTAAMNGRQYKCIITNPCGSTTTNTVTLTVPAVSTVTASPSSQTTAAGGGLITPIVITNSTGGTFSWAVNGGSFPAGVTGSMGTSGTTNISGTLQNTSGTSKTVTFNINPTSACNGPQITATVTIPAALPCWNGLVTGSTAICQQASDFATLYSITNVSPDVAFTWGAVIAGGSSMNPLPLGSNGTTAATSASVIWDHTFSGAASFTVTATGANNNFCTTVGPTTVNVTLNALPTVSISGGTTICAGSTATINFTGTPGALVTYTVNAGADQTVTLGTSGPSTGKASVTSPSTVNTYIYVVKSVKSAVANGGCTTSYTPGSEPTTTVNVVAIPSATATPSTQTICSGDAIAPINIISSTGTFTWTASGFSAQVTGTTGASGNESSSTISGTISNTSNTPKTVTFTITPTGTCAGTQITATVIVNPRITPNAVGSVTYCNNDAGAAIAFGPGGGGAVFNWTSSNDVGFGISGTGPIPAYTATNAGTSPLTASVAVTVTVNGCTGPARVFNITVNPKGQVNQVSSQVLCNGSGTAAANFITVNTGGTTTYTWTNNNISIGLAGSGTGNIASFTATNTGTSPAVATIEVTPHFTNTVTCDGPKMTFTITVNPEGQVDQPASQVVCNGGPVAVGFTTQNTGGTTIYSWTNNNTSIGLAANGIGDIGSFAATNSTSSPKTATIIVTPHFINGLVSCDGPTKSFTITVNPTAEVEQPASQVVCNNGSTATVSFTTTTSGGTASYSWENDNTSIGLLASGSGDIASFTATNSGTSPQTANITVTPHFTNGSVTCDGPTKSFTITVNPTAEVEQPSDQVVCNNASTDVVSFSSTNGGGTTTYSWTNDNTSIGLAASGSGDISAFIATNSSSAPATATITVTPHFTNGSVTCDGPTKTFTITVNPTAQVNQPASQVLCNGSGTSAVSFGTTNTGGTTTYTWTNDNASIGLTTSGSGDISSFTATNTGTSPEVATIIVTPHFSNGSVTCDGPTKTFTITVNPTAEVNQPASQVVCNNSGTAAVNFTTTTSGGAATYTWANDNTSIGLAGSGSGNISGFTATNGGTSPVVATIVVTPHFSNGSVTCDGPTKSFTITVNPTAEVDQPASQVVCNNSGTAAVNFTTTNSGGTTTYSWTNNTTSIGLGASGNGNIASFTATNGGTSPVVATITVTPHFTNGSVTCDGPTKSFTIKVNPTAQVNQPASQVVCNNSGTTAVNFSTLNTGGTTTYTWTNDNSSIGLGVSGSGNIASFTATNGGTSPQVATIIVTPHFTCGSVTCDGPTKTFTITVNPTGEVDQPASQVVCNNTSTALVTFTTTNTGGTTTYTWTNNTTSIGLAASGSGNIAAFTATNSSTATVVATIIVTPHFTNGSVTCDGPTKSFTISVKPSPSIATQPVSTTKFVGQTATFTVVAAGLPTGYQWQVNTGSGWTPVTNTGVYSGATTATLTLTGVTFAMNGYQYKCVVTGECAPTVCTNIVTLTVNKRGTTLVYTGAASVQYSDQVNLSATLTDVSGGSPLVPISGESITFTIGSQSVSALTNSSGVATATLIITQDPAPSYNVVTTFAGDATYVASSDTDPFDITQEDARITYTGAMAVATSSTTSTTATVTLSATIRDITAVPLDPAYDAFAGDIRNAKVVFVIDGVDQTAVSVGLVNLSDIKTGTAVMNTTLSLGDHTIGIKVINYYTRYSSSDDIVVQVYQANGDFITGGGYITLTSSSNGQKAGDAGSKNNFGFNVKYNKSGTNLQGNINTIIRRTEAGVLHTYQVKGNSMTSLGVTGISNPGPTTPACATFNGKATITDITNPLSAIAVDGGASLTVVMTDYGEPGSSDNIGITVYNKSGGLWYSSNWDGTKTAKQVLGGGNLVVHSSVTVGSPCNTTSFAMVNPNQPKPKHEAPDFSVKIAPNPSQPGTEFTLVARGKHSETVEIKVMDMYGKTVYQTSGSANQTYRFGGRFVSGMYIVQVLHGTDVTEYKVVKGN